MGHRLRLRIVTPSEDAYADTKVGAGLFTGEIKLSTCCIATVKLPEERVVQLFKAVAVADVGGQGGGAIAPPLLLRRHFVLYS